MNATLFKNLTLLTAIIVFIVDLSGWSEWLLDMVSHITHRRAVSFKPFTCSLCASWWAGIIYLVATHNFTIPALAVVAALSFLTRPMAEFFQTINDLLIKLVLCIFRKF